MFRVVLCCSLLANLVLSLLFVANPVPKPPAVAAAPLARPPARRMPPPRARGSTRAATAGARGYYEHLLSLDLTDTEAKTLLRARLQTAAAAELNAPDDTYWRSGAEQRIAYTLAAFDRDTQLRSALTAIFGAAAERDSAFSTLFRPLDPHFPFLSSAQQLTVQHFRLERQLSGVHLIDRVCAGGSAAPTSGQSGSRGRGARSAAASGDPQPSLADVLDEPSLLEYELRDSPLADRLRGAGIAFTEQEFREVYAILRGIETGGGDVSGYLDSRTELRRILGTRRYTLLRSATDPVYAGVERIGRERGWSEETTLSAYAALADYGDRLLAVADTTEADPVSAASQVQALTADLERQLNGLVGEEGARVLIDARSAQLFIGTPATYAPRIADGQP